MNYLELQDRLSLIRSRLDTIFSKDTAYPGSWGRNPGIPSAGHCCVVSLLLQDLLGGILVEGRYPDSPSGSKHWILTTHLDDNQYVAVDITADQFGRAPIMMSKPGYLATWLKDQRIRERKSIGINTIKRYELLKQRYEATHVD